MIGLSQVKFAKYLGIIQFQFYVFHSGNWMSDAFYCSISSPHIYANTDVVIHFGNYHNR